MEVVHTKDKEEVAKKASLQINKILKAHSHVPILFLSSGGSSLLLLDQIEIFPANFTVGMTDERFDENAEVNNFAKLCKEHRKRLTKPKTA